MRKILLAVVALFTPALAMSANKELNRDITDPMTGSGAIEPLNHMRTASGTQEVIGVEGTVHRDGGSSFMHGGGSAARMIDQAATAITAAFTSLRRQSRPLSPSPRPDR